MSTPNFYYKNMLYVVELNSEDEDTNEMILRNTQDNITSEVLSLKLGKNTTVEEVDEWEVSSKSYEGKIFLTITASREFYDKEYKGTLPHKVQLQLVIRDGYYAHCNIDTIQTYLLEGSEFESPEDFESKAAGEWAEKKMQYLQEKIENVVSKYTQKIRHVATFSNGEAIYERA